MLPVRLRAGRAVVVGSQLMGHCGSVQERVVGLYLVEVLRAHELADSRGHCLGRRILHYDVQSL